MSPLTEVLNTTKAATAARMRQEANELLFDAELDRKAGAVVLPSRKEARARKLFAEADRIEPRPEPEPVTNTCHPVPVHGEIAFSGIDPYLRQLERWEKE